MVNVYLDWHVDALRQELAEITLATTGLHASGMSGTTIAAGVEALEDRRKRVQSALDIQTDPAKALVTCPNCGANLFDSGVRSWQALQVPQDIELIRLNPDGTIEIDHDTWLTDNDDTFYCVMLECGECYKELPADQQVLLGRAMHDEVYTPTWTKDRLTTESPAPMKLDPEARERIIENVLASIDNSDSVSDFARGARCVLQALSNYDGATTESVMDTVTDRRKAARKQRRLDARAS
jgi:hypothetical protein